MHKVKFAIVHRLFAHFKNAKEGKVKKAKVAIVYHQQAEILASKCAIVYRQYRQKFKICNCLLSSLVRTRRRREITKAGGEEFFQKKQYNTTDICFLAQCRRPHIHSEGPRV